VRLSRFCQPYRAARCPKSGVAELITSCRLDPEDIANVMTFLRYQRPAENADYLVDEVQQAIESGRHAIFDWLAEHMRGKPLVSIR
jgi:hypothetical protein